MGSEKLEIVPVESDISVYSEELGVLGYLSSKNDDFLNEIINCAPDNENYLKRLETKLDSSSMIIPFCGAGISVPYKYPAWKEYLLGQADKAKCQTKVEKLLDMGEYEKAANFILDKRKLGLFEDALEDTFESVGSIDKLLGSATFIPLLSQGLVITTNYDSVLENVYSILGFKYEKFVGAQASAASRALTESRPFLLKIHGDIRIRKFRILTGQDYDRYYGKIGSKSKYRKSLPKLLKRIFKNHCVLFLGCSLANDRTMMILEDIAGDSDAVSHYAILPKPPKEKYDERLGFLSERRIRPIFYPSGQDHILLTYLLAYFVRKFRADQPIVSFYQSLADEDWSMVIEQGKELLARAPKCYEIKAGVANAHYKSIDFLSQSDQYDVGNLSLAIDHLSNAINYAPENFQYRIYLAWLHFIKGDYDASLIDVGQVEDLGYKNVVTEITRAANLIFKRKYQEARKIINSIRDVDKFSQTILDTISSYLYIAEGKIDDGIVLLKRVLDAEPSYSFLKKIFDWLDDGNEGKKLFAAVIANGAIWAFSKSLKLGLFEMTLDLMQELMNTTKEIDN